MAIIVSGYDITPYVIIIGIAFAAYAASFLYRDGKLKLPSWMVGTTDAQAEAEGETSNMIVPLGVPADIKFLNCDTDMLYDMEGFVPEFESDNGEEWEGTFMLKDDSGEHEQVANHEQVYVPWRKRLLEGSEILIRYSKRGMTGIMASEVRSLKRKVSEAMLENSNLRKQISTKRIDIDEQIALEQESRGKHRRSPTTKGNITFNKPRHEKDDFDDDQNDEGIYD